MKPTKLEAGMVIQLSPMVRNDAFAGCFMVVTEPKSFGAQGYVQVLGDNAGPGGQAYLRPSWEQMEYVGKAIWIAGSIAEKEQDNEASTSSGDTGEPEN